ncbi:Uncharacterized membrane protein [Mesorhizobium albiziae]|uniref:Uncharacterized membrane protein n=1 Tax=Neomesorhizobium albiziae TaxID=335020 RepID=A0A1I4C874_9HYPH|nr:DUF599 family protein [Mesorhizobium albiziae]GLS29488.1 membrane protein [Mesorhizobium albiziae]SFK77312.1 Uncharacterized membrane protein [Mesorhizobium albiziae]
MGDSFILSGNDLAALAFFLLVWAFFALAADGKLFSRVSLTTAMNAQREAWMRTMARRELRMIDTSIMIGLQQGTAFFASSSIFAIGGCFALLGASERVLTVLSDMPYIGSTSRGLFETKVLGLVVLLAHAFFKFGWSYRLFNYCSILIGAVPVTRDEATNDAETEAAVVRAAKMNILAGKHFAAGLQGIFFSIAYLGWFVNAGVFALTTLLLLAVLIRRQFFSAARAAVLAQAPAQTGPGSGVSMRPDNQ